MQLHETYPDRLHVISLNVDFDGEGEPPSDLQRDVRAMLNKQGVTCETIMCSDPTDDVLDQLEIFSLPAALIYDQQGDLLRKFDSMVDYPGVIDPLVKEILATSAGDR